MQIRVLALASVLATVPLLAQRRNVTINAQTIEGNELLQIGQEADEAKKIALFEQFVAKYPKYEALDLVYGMLVASYTKTQQFDKVMEAGEKALELDPLDARTAHACLTAAEAKKDPDLVRKWAVKTSDVARKAAAIPKPADEDAVDAWKQEVDFAKQLDTYTEYSLYAAALQTTDPGKRIALIETLEQRNPQSKYLPQVTGPYFLALLQAGQNDKAVAVAEKTLEKDQTNEDMLLSVADYHTQRKQQPEKVLDYSAKLVALMTSKAKPEGVSDADWQKKKEFILGRGHYMTGVTYSGQNKFPQADTALRAALPYLHGDQQMLAGALFLLGLANYKMEKIVDAIKFNEQCAAIKSPYQAQAAKNLKAIHSQYRLVPK